MAGRAVEALIMVAEDRGPLMHAHVGMMSALNHGRPSPVTTRRERARAYGIVR